MKVIQPRIESSFVNRNGRVILPHKTPKIEIPKNEIKTKLKKHIKLYSIY